MPEMTTQDKARAMRALLGTHGYCLRVLEDGRWCVEATALSIHENCGVTSTVGCPADGPFEAINLHWQNYVENLKQGQCLHVGFRPTSTRFVKWNGFMWEQLQEKAQE